MARRLPGKPFDGTGFVQTVLDCTEDEWSFAFELNVRPHPYDQGLPARHAGRQPRRLDHRPDPVAGSIEATGTGLSEAAAGAAFAARRPMGRLGRGWTRPRRSRYT